MLILGRKQGEKVIIEMDNGEKVEVLVKETNQGQVKLGFDADESILIDREEIYEKRKGEESSEDVETDD